MICTEDMSNGFAFCKIPVVNLVDNEDFTNQKFIYVEENVDRQDFVQKKLGGCSCTDICRPETCECIQRSSIQLMNDHRIDLRQQYPDFYETILVECNKRTCKGCQGKCGWRLTPDRFNLNVEIFKTPVAGWAVRSRQFIEAGTYIAEFVGEICDQKRMELRPIEYAYNLPITNLNKSSNIFVDPYYFGNITRFFNHSCSENLQPFRFLSKHRDKTRISLGFFASRDIVPGDELTIDYGLDWWIEKIEKAKARGENFFCSCDWIYCVNPAPGKLQTDVKNARSEMERRMARNHKMLKDWKDQMNKAE